MKPSFTELRESLLVQKKIMDDDGFGGLMEQWIDHKTVWGKVEFVSAKDITSRTLKDIIDNGSVLRKSLYRLTLRQDPELPSHLRIKRQNQMFVAMSRPIEDGQYMILYIMEI